MPAVALRYGSFFAADRAEGLAKGELFSDLSFLASLRLGVRLFILRLFDFVSLCLCVRSVCYLLFAIREAYLFERRRNDDVSGEPELLLQHFQRR